MQTRNRYYPCSTHVTYLIRLYLTTIKKHWIIFTFINPVRRFSFHGQNVGVNRFTKWHRVPGRPTYGVPAQDRPRRGGQSAAAAFPIPAQTGQCRSHVVVTAAVAIPRE